jgi:hypothetical protein
MAQQDLKNNQSIRKVLVRHWIDLGRVNIYSRGGTATIRGTLQLLRGVKHELDAALVERIFREINRIREIKRVTVELENWAFIEGVWHKKEDSSSGYDSFSEGKSYEM